MLIRIYCSIFLRTLLVLYPQPLAAAAVDEQAVADGTGSGYASYQAGYTGRAGRRQFTVFVLFAFRDTLFNRGLALRAVYGQLRVVRALRLFFRSYLGDTIAFLGLNGFAVGCEVNDY